MRPPLPLVLAFAILASRSAQAEPLVEDPRRTAWELEARRRVDEGMARFRDAYRRGDPSRDWGIGEAQIGLVIGRDGRVASVGVLRTTFPDPEVLRPMLAAILRWRFRAPPDQHILYLRPRLVLVR